MSKGISSNFNNKIMDNMYCLVKNVNKTEKNFLQCFVFVANLLKKCVLIYNNQQTFLSKSLVNHGLLDALNDSQPLPKHIHHQSIRFFKFKLKKTFVCTSNWKNNITIDWVGVTHECSSIQPKTLKTLKTLL